MRNSNNSPESIQAQYYTATASGYDEMHTANARDEHFVALEWIEMLSSLYDLKTFLDVGAGTGRATTFLLNAGRQVRGVEPVPALVKIAEAAGVPKGLIVEGSGDALPFENGSFDAVLECGVLHHVKDPSRVVTEMLRVAKRAVFLSDSNRFGQGSFPLRLIKLFLCKSHLWNTARFIQTKGKMYTLSEGDGLAYSYSVFDSYDQLAQWADQIMLFSTGPDLSPGGWFHPLLTAPHVLLCALKH
jgi:ubiquinone/menaquinone biosynthesis C-methylase UbiE